MCNDVYNRAMDSRELIKRLKADGWFQVSQEGDHVQFKHPTKPGRVTVPHPAKDIPAGTLGSIRRQSGLSLREDIKSSSQKRS
jgi:predicted RNA binding protein YcfA (HicA-like mRNA interferase family)